MADQELDCRGLACPNPVIKTKEIIDQEGPERLTVLMDNLAARENVSRFLQRSGYEVLVAEHGGDFAVTGKRLALPLTAALPPVSRRLPARRFWCSSAPTAWAQGTMSWDVSSWLISSAP